MADRGRRSRTGAPPHDFNIRTTIGAEDPDVNHHAPPLSGYHIEHASTSAQSTSHFYQPLYSHQAMDARSTSGAGVGDPNYYASSQQSNISYAHNVNPSAPLQPGYHIEHASTSAQSTSHFYQPLYSHQAMDARSTSCAGVGDPNYYASSQQSNISYAHNVNPSAPLQPGHYVEQASTSAQSTGYFNQQRYLSQAMNARATSGAGVGDPNYHASSQAGQILYQAQPRYQYQPAYRHVDPAASGLQAPPTASFVPLLSIGHNVAPRVLEPQYHVAPPHPPTQAPGPAIMNPGFDMSTRPGRLLNQAGRGQLAHYGPRVRQQVGTAGPPEQQLAFQRPPSRPPSRGQRGGKSRGGQQRPDPAIQSATQGQTLRGQSREFRIDIHSRCRL
ncbi:hypothetical protein V5799_024100 [Amblyomma americanum]|uniref:Uncharacterized protein n=1 Tax=Amblyomma americanum TaxID=6943 RepID=A0AAQ4ECZ5_AMBAM